LRVDYPSVELLVIDNASNDLRVQQLVRASYPSVRYVRELRPGLNWARNRAILEARSEILAFVDDDVVVEPEWLRALATVFAQHPDVMVVTGLVIPYELESEAQALFEQHGGLGRGFARRWVRVAQGETLTRAGNVTTFGTGANMAFRRAIFDRVGGFDPALDAGTVAAAGGDTEIFLRLLKAGSTLVYEPAAVVRHRHRREYGALRAQLTNWSIGVHAALTATMLRYPDERVALTAFIARLLLLYFPRRLARAITGSAVRADLVLSEYGGAFVGLVRYPAARRHAISVTRQFSAGPATYACHGEGFSVSARAAPPSRDVPVDLAAPLPAVLPGTDGSDRVRVILMRSSEVLGAVDVVAGGAPVSRIRLSDAVVAFSGTLVDAPLFARELARRLTGGD
jgi:GT2 family glycosyltransferase